MVFSGQQIAGNVTVPGIAVTATQNGTGAMNGMALTVTAVTGARAAPGNVASKNGATPQEVAVTPAGGPGSWARVQSLKTVPVQQVPLITINGTFASNVTAGNRIILYTVTVNGTADVVVSDSQGNVYTMLVGGVVSPKGLYADIWTAMVTATGTLTITVKTGFLGGQLAWTAEEYSGLDTSAGSGCLDKAAAGTGNNNTTANANSGTTAATTGAGQLAVSLVADIGNTRTWTVSSGGFTKNAAASIDASADNSMAAGNKTSSSGATENCVWTCGAVLDSDVAVVAVIKLAPPGGGSWIYGAVADNASSTTWTPDAASTFTQNVSDAANTGVYGTFRSTSLTSAGTPKTTGASSGGSGNGANGGVAVAEIIPFSSLAEDASSPAPVWTTAAATITTAPFFPPSGAVLVAQVAANGTGITMTVSDAGGLTWTEVSAWASGTSGYAGVWTAIAP